MLTKDLDEASWWVRHTLTFYTNDTSVWVHSVLSLCYLVCPLVTNELHVDVRRSRRTLLSYIIVIVIKQRDIRHSHTKFSGCLRATIYEIVIILYDYHSSIVSFLLPFLWFWLLFGYLAASRIRRAGDVPMQGWRVYFTCESEGLDDEFSAKVIDFLKIRIDFV